MSVVAPTGKTLQRTASWSIITDGRTAWLKEIRRRAEEKDNQVGKHFPQYYTNRNCGRWAACVREDYFRVLLAQSQRSLRTK